jgi:hypothetical protein
MITAAISSFTSVVEARFIVASPYAARGAQAAPC